MSAEVLLPKGDQFIFRKVIDCKRIAHGQPVGRSHTNPILDTHIYQVKFPDGHSEEYTANTIAECIYSLVDDEGKQYVVIDEIIDWQMDETVLDESNKF
jgi:hypothetical protein